MNKGIITKIHIDEDGVKYNIRLDRNVKTELSTTSIAIQTQ